MADKVLLDTSEHIKYFLKTFNLKKDKFVRVFVGSDERVFYSRSVQENNKFIIHFHGSYIPLQGVKYVLNSAKELEKYEDIEFNIIGSKIKKEYAGEGFKNVNFIENVPYNKLPEYINSADICLGIFGDTSKMEMVIPNKIFEAISVKKPVITANTLAIRELFDNNKNILLCKKSNSKDLTEKILLLKQNENLRRKISENSFNLFKEKLTPEILVKNLLNDLKK